MKFIVDFSDSNNKEKAVNNLLKFGARLDIENINQDPIFEVDTDLSKRQLGIVFQIPSGKITEKSVIQKIIIN